MILISLYVLGFLSQYIFCFEIDENNIIILPLVFDMSEDFNHTETISETLDDVDESTEYNDEDVDDDDEDYDDEDYDDDSSEASVDGVNFVGPVQAKGSVLVGANFGFDSPLNPISFPKIITNGIWYPNLYPAPYSFYTPYTFSHGPLVSMFLQDISSGESLEQLGKDLYLEVTPLNYGEFVAGTDGVVYEREVDDEEEANFDDNDDSPEDGDEENEAGKAVPIKFGGLLPASGKITVAAKF